MIHPFFFVFFLLVMVNWNVNSCVEITTCIVSIHVKTRTPSVKPNVHSIFVFRRTISARFLGWCLSTQFQSLTTHNACVCVWLIMLDYGNLINLKMCRSNL
jgi:hypothetical protein